MTKKEIKIIEKRVDRGIKWLDKNKPGWQNRIVFKRLRMSSDSTCICGQLFGSFSESPFGDHNKDNLSISLGFYTPPPTDYQYYSELGEIWKRKIRAIRKKARA